MSLRKLLKLKHEVDRLELDIQKWRVEWGPKLQSLILDKGGELGQPFASNEVDQSHKVDFDLPAIFDDDDEEENEEVNNEEGLIRFGLPPIFYDYGDEGALDFKELGETLVPYPFVKRRN